MLPHFYKRFTLRLLPTVAESTHRKQSQSTPLSCAHLRHALITLLFTYRVNFDFDFEGRGERVRLSKILTPVIQWCGLNIDITHLEVRLVTCLSVC
jgi:hypothetical protein